MTEWPQLRRREGKRRFRMIIPSYPAFNIYSSIARTTTALGPVMIATVVNKMEGWEVEVIDENNYRRFGPRDAAGRPDHATLQRIRPADVVGFYGGLTSTVPRLYELADWYRQQGAVTIGGGQHFAGANVDEALRCGLDYVVRGEGDETIRELLLAIAGAHDPHGVAGIAFRDGDTVVRTAERTLLTDFDRLPCPDFTLLRYARVKLYPVAWVRGCGMQCEFCTVKGRVRCPAPEYVMEQITSLLEKRRALHFFLVDDLFGQNRGEALRLCEMLRDYQQAVRIRLDITVQIRLDKAKDGELLTAMHGAGINTVAIGFESPIPAELAAMNKRTRPEDMLELTRLFRRAGFLVHGMFIFGYPMLPGTDFAMSARERVQHFRRFIRAAQIDTVQVLLPVPLPGTELTERLRLQNRIYPREIVGWEYYDGNFPVFEPDPPLTAEELQASLRLLMGRFYRFRHMFWIGLNVAIFPALVFSLHNIRSGWRRWYRPWRNSLMRFSGWIILQRWTRAFKHGGFRQKLAAAKRALAGTPGAP